MIALRLNASDLPQRRVHLAREQVENPADRRGGGRRVDRAEHQVPRLGRVHGRAERLAVAHLAHQDDVRVLPHGVLERHVPVDHVDADLALVDDRLVVLEREFDRVLDRDDVQPLALVHVLEHRGDRRALARPGDAREDDDPLIVLGDLGQDRREAEILEVGDLVIDPPGHQAEPAALLEQVDAEAGLQLAVEDDMGEVDAPFLVEDSPLPRREQRKHQPLHVGGAQRRKLHLPQDAGQPHAREPIRP